MYEKLYRKDQKIVNVVKYHQKGIALRAKLQTASPGKTNDNCVKHW